MVFLTVNNSRMTTNVGHREATSINLNSPSVAVGRTRGKRLMPPLTLCQLVTPKEDRVTTLYTLWTSAGRLP